MKDYVPGSLPAWILNGELWQRNMGLISGQRSLMMPVHLRGLFYPFQKAIKNIPVLIIKRFVQMHLTTYKGLILASQTEGNRRPN